MGLIVCKLLQRSFARAAVLKEMRRDIAEIKGTLAEVLKELRELRGAPQQIKRAKVEEEEEPPKTQRTAVVGVEAAAVAEETATKEEEEAKKKKNAATGISAERSCAEALMMACDERLGAQSPAALMVCDTFLARDLWTSFVHQSYLPPAARQMWTWSDSTPTEVTALHHGRCIHAVACGWFTMAVVDDGELWATGYNFYGQLGLGDRKNRSTFTRVSGLSGRKVAAVACGNNHTLALIESGELFACGYNFFGQLGLGETINRTTPEPVAALSGRRVVAIACGDDHSVAVLETGELFAWGYNYKGQLGLGDNAKRNEPTSMTALAGRRVVAVACGGEHTAAVLESGELFTWGWNEQGQLGLGKFTESKNMPQLVEALRGRPVIAVACGNIHTLALLKTGEVFAWGRNGEGQLGLGECSEDFSVTPQQVHFFDGKRVISIHCGFDSSAAVLVTGELFTWGMINKEFSPVQVAALAHKHVLSAQVNDSFAVALVGW